MLTFESWQKAKIGGPKITLTFDASDCTEEDDGNTTRFFGTLYLTAEAPGFQKRAALDLDHRTDREMYPWRSEAGDWFAKILGLFEGEPDDETYVPGGFSFADSMAFIKDMVDSGRKFEPPPFPKPEDFTEFDHNMDKFFDKLFGGGGMFGGGETGNLFEALFDDEADLGKSGTCVIDYGPFAAARALIAAGEIDKAVGLVKGALSSASITVNRGD